MSHSDLHLHLDAYLSVRAGPRVSDAGRAHAPARLCRASSRPTRTAGPIRAQLAVDWACASSAQRGRGGAAQRLSMARGFLTYLRATLPETEVPDRGLVASFRRPQALPLDPIPDHRVDPRRPATSVPAAPSAPIPSRPSSACWPVQGSGWVRPSASREQDVHLDDTPPACTFVRPNSTNPDWSRSHPTTVVRSSATIAAVRTALRYAALADIFFVSEQGHALTYHALGTLVCAALSAAWPGAHGGGRRPSLHALRHAFAIERIRRWYQDGRRRAGLAAPPLRLSGPRPSPGKLLVSDCHPRTLDRRGACDSSAMRRKEVPYDIVHVGSCTYCAPRAGLFHRVHLCHHKRVSPQTIASCRDTFRLLLTFVKETVGIEPSAPSGDRSGRPTGAAFLDYLEHHRGNAVRSRNIRLSALRTFFRFVALRDPESLTIATRVLAIPREAGRQEADWVSDSGRDGGAAGGPRPLPLDGAPRSRPPADHV